MPKKEEKINKNLEPVEIEKRIDKLLTEIVSSEDPEFGYMYLLWGTVKSMAMHEAIAENIRHEEEFHRKTKREN